MGNRRLGAQRLQALMKRGASGLDTAYQTGAGMKAAIVSHKMFKLGGTIETQILVDLQGGPKLGSGASIFSHTNDNSYIGEATAGDATGAVEGVHLLLWENDVHGDYYAHDIICVELPVGGADDLTIAFDAYAADEKMGNAQNSATLVLADQTDAWQAGDRHLAPDPDGTTAATTIAALTDVDGTGLYMSTGESGTAVAYSAGKFLIRLWGYDTQWGF